MKKESIYSKHKPKKEQKKVNIVSTSYFCLFFLVQLFFYLIYLFIYLFIYCNLFFSWFSLKNMFGYSQSQQQ